MRRPMLMVIALLEIIGGVAGPVRVVIDLSQAGFPAEQLPGAALATGVFLLALFAGVMLWRDRRIGYTTSALVQFAQLLKFVTSQFAFVIGFGGDVIVMSSTKQDAAGNTLRGLTIHFQAGPYSAAHLGPSPGVPLGFGVSLVSCVALALLRKGQQLPVKHDSTQTVAGPATEIRPDGEPGWVPPFWLKVAVGLFILVVAICAGVLGGSR